MTETDRKQVAIIGGGPAGLAAAFELTADGRDDEYDVTIYQQGWRLGGKCASGRNPDAGFGERIEEHGLHIWFGCYTNARRILERCYAELAEGAETAGETRHARYRSFEDAFEGVDTIVLGQRADERWAFNELVFLRNRTSPLNFGDFVSEALAWTAHRLVGLRRDLEDAGEDEEPWWEQTSPVLGALGLDEPDEGERLDQVRRGASRLSRQLTGIYLDLRQAADMALAPSLHLDRYVELVEGVLPQRPGEPPEVTFYRDTVRILFTVLRGVWEDQLLDRGFDAINDKDLAEWLRGHGLELEENPLEWPALLRAVYDGCFAFAGGDPDKPSVAAGRALQGAIRCVFHYEGSVLHRPQGSMSDVLIAPVTQRLMQRGVTIRYFHPARRLGLSDDRTRISEIEVVRQVPERVIRALAPAGQASAAAAAPPKWSTKLPDSLGIKSSQRLEQEIDPFGGEPLVMREDDEEHGFDWVILAVPPDVQSTICHSLAEADTTYARMLENADSVVTQAGQLWLRKTASELGQDFRSDSLMSCYVEPLDTYADMAHLTSHEGWTKDDGVRHIAYFCGVLEQTGLDDQAAADEQAKEGFARFLSDDLPQFWPHSVKPGTNAFDPDLLVPRRTDRAQHALDDQYSRANWAATERYVLTLPDSVQYRLPARGTRFSNLVLAGDWTKNGFDAGCLEAAVTSGRLAAQAICGLPRSDDIPGVNGPPGFPSAGPPAGPRRHEVLDQLGHMLQAAESLAEGGIRLVRVTVDALRRREF